MDGNKTVSSHLDSRGKQQLRLAFKTLHQAIRTVFLIAGISRQLYWQFEKTSDK